MELDLAYVNSAGNMLEYCGIELLAFCMIFLKIKLSRAFLREEQVEEKRGKGWLLKNVQIWVFLEYS